MAAKVVMPKLGLTMKFGLVVLWHLEEGDEVEKGEDLLEIESDKVTTLVEAPASGIVRKVIAEEDEVVPCGMPVAIIAEEDEEISDLDEIVAASRAVIMSRDEYLAKQSLEEAPPEPSSQSTAGGFGKIIEVKASPVAKRLAREHGINLSSIKGSGPDGRIVREDVLAAAEGAGSGGAESAAESIFEGRPGESVAIGKMRRAISENMARSAHTVARVVHMMEVDMSKAVAHREANKRSFKEKHGADLSYNSLLIKAVAEAMREDSALNISFDGKMIRNHEDVNIGLAVALDEGLITVSIKDADKKDLKQIALDSAKLIEKARAGTFGVDDVTGSSITISSLGPYDIDCFTPVINLPEAAIIGIGSIVRKPVVRDDKIEIAPIMKLSLSFDHRLVDGAPAAAFLQKLKNKLEALDFVD